PASFCSPSLVGRTVGTFAKQPPKIKFGIPPFGYRRSEFREKGYGYRMVRGAFALFATLVAGAGLTNAAATSRPLITMADGGKTFTLRTRQTATLRLTERYHWTRPKVTGNAVKLAPVDYIRDPGFLEWQVRAASTGTARITAVGYGEGRRGCDPGPCSPHLF